MRNKIFISHASPDDNDFTKWLSLKLIDLGYEVWCDVLYLDKGVDFWKVIERELRENTVKFLFVATSVSIIRDGVMKEVALAEKVKKQLNDDSFIIPLITDKKLSHNDLPLEIIRLNAIGFKDSWAIGLKDLLDALQKKNVPKSIPDPQKSQLVYQQLFRQNRGVIEREETYDSNWFNIISFPSELRFHLFDNQIPKGYDIRNLPYPAVRYKKFLCTFAWEYDFIDQLPKTKTYSNTETRAILIEDILSGKNNSNFINNHEAKRIIIQLTNKAFEIGMKARGLSEYQMSNKLGFWAEKGKFEKDKFHKVLLVGKQKEKNWHFGISASSKLYPFPVLTISSHIYFTHNGIDLIESKNIQHSARRKQGKDWWNDDWRNKLVAFVKSLSEDAVGIKLKVGSEEIINISCDPVKFFGKASYDLPEKNNLLDEVELYPLDSVYENENNEEDQLEEME
ncbi:toll/interleukin-1 receptor domain-containing protein [Leptospira bandrabouensis]|uniref:toll/interleukin-1 receptor domain-containing protein n=1 Tax=Leptospira bandrabouensis TaxID=2484903 RepID=UPI00223E5033|nr:toll/interleukin-1 receptor domain-containing protein [Leptospira bandrabouensis]MCW7458562.1 toll/interleukin-1 receptor domain-containing protein [Leptospira bandrabouensis]MCW7478691.1 toll/interleukin-1 receptor domain-containing protein [Leptospira bandrabouensis]MCW7486645.1 toll/interleukin-1 receptor domain-containing protein [Leptospira bandrabouensis]